MKKLIKKGKPLGKAKKPLSKKPLQKNKKKKPEIKGLLKAEQPLFYFGPPPAIKNLYKNKNEYDSDFHPQDLLKHMQEGTSRSEICAAWGITYSTFNNWIDDNPEFAEAYSLGKPAYDGYYKRALRHSAFGQIKGVREGSLFFMLKNVAGYVDEGGDHEYGDSNEAEVEFVDDNE